MKSPNKSNSNGITESQKLCRLSIQQGIYFLTQIKVEAQFIKYKPNTADNHFKTCDLSCYIKSKSFSKF